MGSENNIVTSIGNSENNIVTSIGNSEINIVTSIGNSENNITSLLQNVEENLIRHINMNTYTSFKIGFLYPKEGPLNSEADNLLKAAEEAIREANEMNNLNFILEAKNAPCQPSNVAPVSANELINNGAQILIGPVCSSECINILNDVSKSSNIPIISYGATSPELSNILGGELFSRTTNSDIEESIKLSDFIYNEKQLKKIIIAYAKNAEYFSTVLSTQLKLQFESLGGTVLGNIEIDIEKVDEDDSSYKNEYTNQINSLSI